MKKQRLMLLFIAVLTAIIMAGCIDDGVETLPLPPLIHIDTARYIAEGILKLDSVYYGNTPPIDSLIKKTMDTVDIPIDSIEFYQGCYLADDVELVKCNPLSPNHPEGEKYDKQLLFKFSSYTPQKGTVSFEAKWGSIESGANVYYKSTNTIINGIDSNFTIRANVQGWSSEGVTFEGIMTLQGTATLSGISNFTYSVEITSMRRITEIFGNEADPLKTFAPIGTIRAYREADGFAKCSRWDLFKNVSLESKKISIYN